MSSAMTSRPRWAKRFDAQPVLAPTSRRRSPGRGRRPAGSGFAEPRPRDDPALDLAGPRVDRGDLRAAAAARARALLGVAVAAEDLYRRAGDLARGLRGEELGLRALDGVRLALLLE